MDLKDGALGFSFEGVSLSLNGNHWVYNQLHLVCEAIYFRELDLSFDA